VVAGVSLRALPPASSDQHPYDRHVGRFGTDLARGLIEVAGVSRGQRVLDVGCGTGQLARALAGVAGAENVAAIDLAESALAVCRARVPEADVRLASAEDLPFDEGEFDAVLAQLVVNLVDDPRLAVREMARVVRPAGAVAACFWDDDEMPLLRSLWDAVRTVAPEALAGVSDQAQVGLADVEVLREWWSDAGLAEVALGEFEVSADYQGFEDLWAPFEAGVGHSGKTYSSLDPDVRARVRAEARRRLGSPEGPFRLTARVRTVRGTKPPTDGHGRA
jgi:ubiquinone/menaquinone biosynthesis C-methylase UbiE